MKNCVEPKYINLLSEEDKKQYYILRSSFATPVVKNRRKDTLKAFSNVIEAIKSYVVRNDDDDWKRGLVCGIIWIDNNLAVNTQQLKILLSKCKSSINGSFHKLGYGTIQIGADSSSELTNVVPILKNNFSELRKWTIRSKLKNAISPTEIIKQMKERAVNYEVTPPPTLNDENNEDMAISVIDESIFDMDYSFPDITLTNDDLAFFDDLWED
ncbi:hypothetical protein TRFO_41518 [Tritrichomonas foetus]|uniref:Initiator binding domain-containing protein n=1 Tax=Tritrichomonas foetus TaxID=1144522 RepID=A0A1J4L4G8_9EUKA|nr:hypothetical protein TRFO_41518 [Tritrichomonas foetus]|eukprot:OHT16868.1 hypothetical protein TRFO_41518 [Tritrichomonas foetus]